MSNRWPNLYVSSRCELLWCGHFFSDGRRTDRLSYVEKTDLMQFPHMRETWLTLTYLDLAGLIGTRVHIVNFHSTGICSHTS